jgi:hypothetical protein
MSTMSEQVEDGYYARLELKHFIDCEKMAVESDPMWSNKDPLNTEKRASEDNNNNAYVPYRSEINQSTIQGVNSMIRGALDGW